MIRLNGNLTKPDLFLGNEFIPIKEACLYVSGEKTNSLPNQAYTITAWCNFRSVTKEKFITSSNLRVTVIACFVRYRKTLQ